MSIEQNYLNIIQSKNEEIKKLKEIIKSLKKEVKKNNNNENNNENNNNNDNINDSLLNKINETFEITKNYNDFIPSLEIQKIQKEKFSEISFKELRKTLLKLGVINKTVKNVRGYIHIKLKQ